MQAKSVSAGQGMEWFKCGWNLFKQDYGNWFIMFLLLIGIAIVLNFIPFIGAIAVAIISPVLMGGLMYSASLAEQGQNIEIGMLFQGFKDKERMNKLLMLGVLSLVAQIVLMLISVITGQLLQSFLRHQSGKQDGVAAGLTPQGGIDASEKFYGVDVPAPPKVSGQCF